MFECWQNGCTCVWAATAYDRGEVDPSCPIHGFSEEYQADEKLAVTEIKQGKGREFEDADEAIRWLQAD